MDEALEEECLALEAIYGDQFSKLDDCNVRLIVEPSDPEGNACYKLAGSGAVSDSDNAIDSNVNMQAVKTLYISR